MIATPYDYVLYIPATVFPGNTTNPLRLAAGRYSGIPLRLDGDAPFGLRRIYAGLTMHEPADVSTVQVSADRWGPLQSGQTSPDLFSNLGLNVSPELIVQPDGKFSFDFEVSVAGGLQWLMRGVKYRPDGSVYPGPPAPFEDKWHVYRKRFSVPARTGAGATVQPARVAGLVETDYDADFVCAWIAGETSDTYAEFRCGWRDAEGRQLQNELIDLATFAGTWESTTNLPHILPAPVIYPAGHPIPVDMFSFSPAGEGHSDPIVVEFAFGGWKRYKR